MTKQDKILLFEEKKVRTVWDDDTMVAKRGYGVALKPRLQLEKEMGQKWVTNVSNLEDDSDNNKNFTEDIISESEKETTAITTKTLFY